MNQFMVIVVALLVGATFLLLPFGDADARRFGGGRSFGSKPMYSQPYSMQRSTVTRTPTAGQLQNKSRRAELAQRGGLWGMLGGLALGGLLGALLFGGAFEGLNFFDILVFAGIAFLLYYLFVMRRRGGLSPAASNYGRVSATAPGEQTAYEDRSERGFDTDLLFKKHAVGSGPAVAPPETPIQRFAGFDRGEFLEGARNAYRRLQESWDKGDLADIRQFTTDAVFAEVQDQLHARTAVNQTEIFKVDAELLEVREVANHLEASVLFDVLMREVDGDEGQDARPYRVREVWHFVRPVRSDRPTWFLDGVQQLED